jgi:hypothetical protein
LGRGHPLAAFEVHGLDHAVEGAGDLGAEEVFPLDAEVGLLAEELRFECRAS